jgi:predicted secreted protein
LLTPAAFNADSISLSEAVFADTLAPAGAVVVAAVADVVAGAADIEGLSLVVVDPPQPVAARTTAVTTPKNESLALHAISSP